MDLQPFLKNCSKLTLYLYICIQQVMLSPVSNRTFHICWCYFLSGTMSRESFCSTVLEPSGIFFWVSVSDLCKGPGLTTCSKMYYLAMKNYCIQTQHLIFLTIT